MAIDVCSEISSSGISPRISFSHDLNQAATDSSSIDQGHELRLDASLLESDFDFCIGSSFVQEVTCSSADELFSNGKILPIEIKKQTISPPPPASIPPRRQKQQQQQLSSHTTEKKKLLKEFLSMDPDPGDEKPITSKSFWQFKRSISLNMESTRSKGLIKSLHFLSRSNSTGSAPNPKKPAMLVPKEVTVTEKPQLRKQSSYPSRKSSVSNSNLFYYPYNSSSQKPPLLRKCGSYGGNGVRISPVLNIPPPPYISRGTVNLFGLGSLFCNSKVKKKKR